ncbi:MAG TPA: sulfatase [Chloroflexota bacterium]|nr:sulfatase [Chloroflexota bacterium]
MPPLNVLYLHSHDTGRYIQPYGHAIPMPYLQNLAQQGVLFRQNFCVAPTCSPSRAGLLTGQYAHSCGQLGLAHRGFELQHPQRHLAWTLRQAGYATVLAGIQHVVRDPSTTGYERIAPGRLAETVAPNAMAFLREHAAGPGRGQPFFLDAGFFETHRRFHAPDPSASPAEDPRYCLPPAPLPDTPGTREDVAAFKASARVLDGAIGAILDTLEATGLADDTLVICTTDHGIAFPAMKCNLTDHGTGVFLIMRGPGGFDGGQVVDAMVSHLDLFPTICDLAGIAPPVWLQGASLLPLVRGQLSGGELHQALFAEVNYHVPYEPQRAVRTTRWKYIRRYDAWGKPMLANCDDGPSKDVWLDHGWADQRTEPEQLYDLVFDPQERHNLAAEPAMAGVVAELRGILERWMQETDDPLLQGPIPAPHGALVGDPGARSPSQR